MVYDLVIFYITWSSCIKCMSIGSIVNYKQRITMDQLSILVTTRAI